MVKISDVARKAGVSVSTVSRILNQDESFSASTDTVKKVHDAVDQLGYKPLRRRSTSPRKTTKPRIALAITISKEGENSDPYWTSIRMGIEAKAKEHGMIIERLVRLDHTLSEEEIGEFDGAIVMGSVKPESLEAIGFQRSKTVMINNMTYDVKGYDCVSSDLYDATVKILRYLKKNGHQRIGFIGGVDWVKDLTFRTNISADDMRMKAFADYMIREGIYNQHDIYIGNWTTSDGHRLMKEALDKESMPSAFLVASDPMSMGVLHAIRESGLRVPEDVSIISYDDIEAAAYLDPPLSSVRLYTEEVGKQAVNLLVDRLKGREVPVKTTIQSQLVARKSHGPYNRERSDGQ